MAEWQKIETAPQALEVERIHARTRAPYTVLVPVRILVARDGVVYPSRRLANGRFEGFTKTEPPTHWMPFPEPPCGTDNG